MNRPVNRPELALPAALAPASLQHGSRLGLCHPVPTAISVFWPVPALQTTSRPCCLLQSRQSFSRLSGRK